MDATKFIKFLALARKNVGYETLSSDNELLENGSKVLGPFTQGNLTYKDSYKGFEKFFGREAISHKGKTVWVRFYRGEIIDKNLTKEQIEEIYTFLKKALSHFPNSHPEQRGPEKYESGLFEYTSTFEGNFEKFKGKEEIFLKGKKVYELSYYN